VIVRKLICVITTFMPLLDLQFATIIEQTVGLQSSTAEDAGRNVREEGNAIIATKSNNSNTTRVVHVNSDLTSCYSERPHPPHEDLASLLLNIPIELTTLYFIPPNTIQICSLVFDSGEKKKRALKKMK
jgi:hypothetical protein